MNNEAKVGSGFYVSNIELINTQGTVFIGNDDTNKTSLCQSDSCVSCSFVGDCIINNEHQQCLLKNPCGMYSLLSGSPSEPQTSSCRVKNGTRTCVCEDSWTGDTCNHPPSVPLAPSTTGKHYIPNRHATITLALTAGIGIVFFTSIVLAAYCMVSRSNNRLDYRPL